MIKRPVRTSVLWKQRNCSSALALAYDLNVRLGQAKKFLQNGDKIKVSIRFRGREMAHTQLGQELLLDFAEKCSELGTVERPPQNLRAVTC